jgi:hypothetical protein
VKSTRDVIVRPSNFEAAVAFYEHTLSFPVTFRGTDLVGFETGAFQLFVERAPDPHGPVFEMKVADVAATKAALLAAGCELVEERPAIPRCYMRDPNGLVFNLDAKS